MLRAGGTCPPPMPDTTVMTVASERDEFYRHLTEACGLSERTCAIRLHHVSDFLADRFGTNLICIPTLTPTDVAHFVMRYTQGWKPASIKTLGNSLRSYFRFKA